jgi:hypothetical protein
MGVHQVPRLLVKNHLADPQCLVEEIGRQASFHFVDQMVFDQKTWNIL